MISRQWFWTLGIVGALVACQPGVANAKPSPVAHSALTRHVDVQSVHPAYRTLLPPVYYGSDPSYIPVTVDQPTRLGTISTMNAPTPYMRDVTDGRRFYVYEQPFVPLLSVPVGGQP